MPDEPPKRAIQLLTWIAGQRAPATEPPPPDRPGAHLTAYPEDFAYLSDLPAEFEANAENVLTFLDGRGWIKVRVFDPADGDSGTCDAFGHKFSPNKQPDALRQWRGLLAKALKVRKRLEALPASGPVHIDNSTGEIVQKPGAATRTVDVLVVRAGFVRLPDVQVCVTAKGRVALALAPEPQALNPFETAQGELAGKSDPTQSTGGSCPADAVAVGDGSTPVGARGAQASGRQPLGLSDPIPIPWLRGVVPKKVAGGTSWHLVQWISRRGHRTEKIAGKWCCERSVALSLFARQKKYIEAYPDAPP